MKTQLPTPHNGSRTCAMTEPVSGRQPVLALLMRLLWAAALALPAFGAQAAVVFTSLYSFTGTNDGLVPNGLVQGSDGSFYGTTQYGGPTNYNYPFGWGTVFKISPSGALTTLYSFTGTNDGGNPPAGLVQGSDGSFYGTTVWGGTTNYNAENGTYGFGTVFKTSTNGALTTLYAFGSITNGSGEAVDGANPSAALVQGSDGSFYGTTYQGGGTNNMGTVFRISPNGALTSLYSFTGGNDGGSPQAGLVQGSDGYFYGTTSGGGTNGAGTVFKISTNGALTSLYSFTGGSDGANPDAALVQGSDGNFYGTTHSMECITCGGLGTVFRINTNGALTSLHSFGWNDGAYPSAGLVQGSDGNFYGTTGSGGTNSYGTVFKISPNGALTSLYSFGSVRDSNGNPLDGEWPAGLVQGSDGSFYGTTQYGGKYGGGTVFRLTIVPEPQLTIIPSAPYVILTWPTDYAGFSYAGYTLQSTTNLGSSAVWTTNSSPPVVIGGQNVVINTMSGRQQFYRLSQ